MESVTSPLISYEIIPPLRGSSAAQLMAVVEELIPFDPPFIDVTSHSAETVYEELPDGTWRRRVKRKRPGTIGICAAIKSRFGIEAVPHVLCHGFTRSETEDALIELNYLDINNVMALHGDDTGFQKTVPAGTPINRSAIELVHQISSMNRGQYLEDLMDAVPTDFCIGVAGYPEKHFRAPNITWDIQYLKRKVEAGAGYITTQMFFDNQHYFHFVKRCREADIRVPIVPGIKILTSKRQLQLLPYRFHIEIPETLAGEVEEAAPKHVKDVGIQWAVRQCEELFDFGVPCVHFYIMQSSKTVLRVVRQLTKDA